MNALATAILAELDDEALDALAAKLAPRIAAQIQPGPADDDRWLTSKEAAVYLGMSVASLHKMTASRRVPFEQDCEGGKLWMKRSQLDRWREAGGKYGNER